MTAVAATPDPILPNDELQASARRLHRMLEEGGGEAQLIGPDGSRASIHPDLYQLLIEAVRELEAGNAVSLVPSQTELTTQQAADLLNVSRPHFIKLLETGELPFRRVGTHRRIALADVLRYRTLRRNRRHEALADLANESEARGVYGT